MLGLAERERAYSTVHEGAVYLHLGRQYLVRELDLQARRALVEPFDGDWYTQAKKETETAIEEPLRVERRLGLELSFGRVSVTEQVVAYQKKAAADGSTLDTVPLDLPPTTFDTEAVWFVPRPHQLEGLEAMPLLLSSLHAAEHSLIALLPLWAMCDRWDIGGLSTNLHLDTGAPTVFVYDGHAGGVGIAERGFDQFEGWVADTGRAARRLPLRARLPVLRPEPEVRQPERVPRQGRRAHTSDEDVEFGLSPFVVESSTISEGGTHAVHAPDLRRPGALGRRCPRTSAARSTASTATFTEDAPGRPGSSSAATQLQPIATATVLRVADGETLTTDGPFAETKEVLGGYYLIDVDTLDEALEWAREDPVGAAYGTIEVRPLVTDYETRSA